jgi:hypothetical protein
VTHPSIISTIDTATGGLMKRLASLCVVLAFGLVAADPALPQGKDDAARLKELFQQSGWVFAGDYSHGKPAGPVSNPQTIYTFTNCQTFRKKIQFGPIEAGKGECAFGVYNTNAVLDATKKGTRLLVFLSSDYGKVNATIAATKEKEKLLAKWAAEGVYSKDERAALFKKAAWVVVVGQPDEICLESFPCQHHWSFPLQKVLKGENVPNTIRIRGRYRTHSEIPAPLRVSPQNGKLILFLSANASADTDVQAALPWSAALEKELK